MANEMEVKVDDLQKHLKETYDNMAEIITNPDNSWSEQAITAHVASMTAIGLAKNCVGFLKDEFESVREAMEKAITDAQKLFEEVGE